MICKECGEDNKHCANGLCRRCYDRQYRESNRERLRENMRRHRYAHGVKPASENKQCSQFLGVHVAEQVLSKVFKNVKQMPNGNKGFDFFCNKGKKIDVKSACTNIRDDRSDKWVFLIKRNKIADFFLCLTFDNRENLNPLYIWLIPAEVINHQMGASISESTLPKWDKYKLDINRIVKCCNTMKHKNGEN